MIKQIGKVLLVALVAVLVLALISIIAFAAGQSFLGTFWRLCSASGAIAMLAAAVLLLTNRRETTVKWPIWKKHFSRLPFVAAVLIVAFVLIAVAGIANYIAL